ncbi:nucleotidyltransferase [Candidatus Parcubacteria bacterium]|nr:nucleotidyltransferase [Candidatus Parcubacteria bacterium]
MAKTIDEGFKIFHSRLTPTKTESESAKKHRASIEACISTNFGLKRFFRTGSFGNGTSIAAYSDVDYFASIPRKSLTNNSFSTLVKLKEALVKRFPDTGVRISSPAVVVPFGTDPSETTEVVPADFIRKNLFERHIYDIPNGQGGWRKSSPDAHNSYVLRYDKKLDGKLKPLIRFIKAWKFYRAVSISSFYLEIFVTKYASSEKTIIYPIDIKIIFKKLNDNKLANITDPLGISGYITACSSLEKKKESLARLKRALTRAEHALTADKNGRTAKAFYWWNKVYADKFPSYH